MKTSKQFQQFLEDIEEEIYDEEGEMSDVKHMEEMYDEWGIERIAKALKFVLRQVKNQTPLEQKLEKVLLDLSEKDEEV